MDALLGQLAGVVHPDVAFVALRPRAGELTEAVAIAEARSLMAEIIPPDRRARRDPRLPEPYWRPVPRELARAVFAYTLGHDLAWDEVEVGEATVGAMTDRFFARFDDAAYFLTTGVYTDGGRLQGWNPLTIHTFEAGIVAVDRCSIGAFWKTAED